MASDVKIPLAVLVTDIRGNVIGGATVSASSPQLQSPPPQITDSGGNATLSLDEGSWTISASFETSTGNSPATLPADKSVKVVVPLP
ncbi:MAG: hypothetical protein JNJ85_08320 [Candidatus Kapabacteria bacterium]|nr:hypothetical protein [Candidatus Kapabacteria bacterium]